MRLKNFSQFNKINEGWNGWDDDYDDGSDNYTEPKEAKEIIYKIVELCEDYETAIFRKLSDKRLYVFTWSELGISDFYDYASLPYDYEEDEDGKHSFKDTNEFKFEDYVVENYVNDNLNNLKYGKGIADYESGDSNFILIDEALKNKLIEETEITFKGEAYLDSLK
jgi:hypothetical protein